MKNEICAYLLWSLKRWREKGPYKTVDNKNGVNSGLYYLIQGVFGYFLCVCTLTTFFCMFFLLIGVSCFLFSCVLVWVIAHNYSTLSLFFGWYLSTSLGSSIRHP